VNHDKVNETISASVGPGARGGRGLHGAESVERLND